MKRLLPLLLTIVVAIIAGFVVAANQKKALIDSLIESSSITDQLRGISLLTNSPLNTLQQKLHSIVDDDSDASRAAQKLLVQRAFQEDRIHELIETQIDSELYRAALWWSNPHEERKLLDLSIRATFNPSPWVMKLIANYGSGSQQTPYTELVGLPLRDRDGSVLLSVLAIEQLAPERIEPLIESWSSDYDFDRQLAAVLLAGLRDLPQPQVSTQNETIATIQKIISQKDAELAWRALHRKDGSIIPDVALAGMIVNQKMFIPILVEGVHSGKWTHPEHAVLIAESFFPEITNKIPIDLLKNPQARQKWWALFTCGLLKEE